MIYGIIFLIMVLGLGGVTLLLMGAAEANSPRGGGLFTPWAITSGLVLLTLAVGLAIGVYAGWLHVE